ncbi:MAG TPA: hypothetical protein VF403_25880 [Kofleriaceae bacterium]
MPISIDHTVDITERDRRTKRSLLAFALIVVVVAVIWLAFTSYL